MLRSVHGGHAVPHPADPFIYLHSALSPPFSPQPQKMSMFEAGKEQLFHLERSRGES